MHTHCSRCGTMVDHAHYLKEVDRWYGNETYYLCQNCYSKLKWEIFHPRK